MKRKFVGGCLGISFFLVAVLFVVFYITVLRPTRAVMGDLEQIAALSSQNSGILNTSFFSPPADDELTQEQVERFARIQEEIRGGLGEEYTVLMERAEKLNGLRTGGSAGAKALTVREAILLFKDLGPILQQAKESQVRGLNRERFSLAEYRWVRESVYRALGFSRFDRYLEDFETGAEVAADKVPERESTDYAGHDQ